MMRFLVTVLVLIAMNVAFADTHVCNFNSPEGSSYKIAFKFNEGVRKDQVLVTIYLNNRVQISHLNNVKVDSDSHGDGWGMTLKDPNHRQYKYDINFDAQNISSAYVTMPGLKDYRIDSCRRLRK
jgi:hypothetical protein